MEDNILFTKLTNNEFDVSVKHGVNALFDIEKTMFSPTLTYHYSYYLIYYYYYISYLNCYFAIPTFLLITHKSFHVIVVIFIQNLYSN